jgi:hypothetical protein
MSRREGETRLQIKKATKLFSFFFISVQTTPIVLHLLFVYSLWCSFDADTQCNCFESNVNCEEGAINDIEFSYQSNCKSSENSRASLERERGF